MCEAQMSLRPHTEKSCSKEYSGIGKSLGFPVRKPVFRALLISCVALDK